MSLRYEEVAEILKIIDSSSCDEVIVETGDIKLVVRRNASPGYVAPAAERTASIGKCGSVPSAHRYGGKARWQRLRNRRRRRETEPQVRSR